MYEYAKLVLFLYGVVLFVLFHHRVTHFLVLNYCQ